ncbi:ribosomal L7Ae/L30e/S12e/Gadd45 family protein [Clostridium sp.]|jgi:ribosomal protein L7Ae-like RNA K-turn-binding protein|nr:ribosomal L7Ae/L30e/S12e/Gadd45 family protein [Clostridium sp.]MCI1716184.1 ribosomal L7Ae/L30e/S12e/Gadd45 family protein [Clostridium sp.]MCI1800576.1 ribosomal L7Ae/L30e/S12e/Gadd45 family protein [Clostridium sp.]MCI1814361.1 ribosomal L7Ae/L30e/S12e/Gadd45 family protein [Clostridium sp.]MCI2201664.1 ribosomal L7Ae/L30e/S12e/Gadd45 family protein [Clostridium sp.]
MKDNFLQFLGIAKRAGKVLEGYNKCEQSIKKRNIRLIILSEDVSCNTLNKFLNYGNKYNIKIIKRYSEKELGCAVGQQTIKVIGITDKNISEKLIDIYKVQT